MRENVLILGIGSLDSIPDRLSTLEPHLQCCCTRNPEMMVAYCNTKAIKPTLLFAQRQSGA